MKKAFLFFIIIFLCLLPLESQAENIGRDVGTVMQGVSKTAYGAFSIPKCMLEDSTRIFFPIGLVTGAIRGTFQTVSWVLSGAFDVVKGAAPYAKYLVFL